MTWSTNFRVWTFIWYIYIPEQMGNLMINQTCICLWTQVLDFILLYIRNIFVIVWLFVVTMKMPQFWDKSFQHDDIMTTISFRHYWPFVRGINHSLVDSPHKGPINCCFIISQNKLLNTLSKCSGWNCQPWPSRSQKWMFVHSIIILSRSQQFPTSSSQNQVELGEWATAHFMHCKCMWFEKIPVFFVHFSLVKVKTDINDLVNVKTTQTEQFFHTLIKFLKDNVHPYLIGNKIWSHFFLKNSWQLLYGQDISKHGIEYRI